MEIWIETVLITPQKAKLLLEKTIGNRELIKQKLELYERQILENKWVLNGQCIIVGDKGHLLDGHHRLQAIVQTDKPAQMSIIHGIKEENFATIDSGASRKSGQVFTIAGIKNAHNIASIVNAVQFLRHNGWLTGSGMQNNLTTTELLEIYNQDADLYQKARCVGVKCRANRLMRVVFASAMYYVLVRDFNNSPDYVERFLVAATSLSTTEIPSANALREALTRKTIEKGTNIDVRYVFALTVKAWQSYKRNENIKRLVVTDDELFNIKLKKNGYLQRESKRLHR